MEFLVALTFVAALLLINWRRAHRQVSLSLEPNCLLTRNPIVFLTGRRSLFYFMRYWNWIPSCLQAHGYEVHTLSLPWRHRSRRANRLLEFLSLCRAEGVRAHFIADATAQAELDLLSELKAHEVASCTRVSTRPMEDQGFIRQWTVPEGALGLGPSEQLRAVQHRYLQLAQDLAEFDLRS